MKITTHLAVSAQAFYTLLLQSLANDVSQAIGHDVDPDTLSSGYTYEKILPTRLGMKAKANVCIEELTPDACYRATFHSVRGINTLSYQIQAVDNGIDIAYEEEYLPNNKLNALNYKIVKGFYARKNKKRVQLLLHAMEMHILKEGN